MNFGSKVEFFEGRLLDSGVADRPLLNRPELFADLAPVWAAWLAMHATRGAGMTEPERITVGSCRDWCDLVGVHDTDERLEFFGRIQVLENAFFKYYRANKPKS